MKKAPPAFATVSPAGLVSAFALGALCLAGDAVAGNAPGGFGATPVPAAVSPESALAMFLIGLAVGVPAGIGLFFVYLIHRKTHETQQDRELDALLHGDFHPRDSAGRGSTWGREPRGGREPFERETSDERRDPWERPADWWRHAGDDA